MADEITSFTGSQLFPLKDLLFTDFTLQISLAVLIFGFIGIFVINKKLSSWINSKKFYYTKPLSTEFVKKILFSLFAVALVVSMSTYIQIFELFNTQSAIDAAIATEELTPRETFAKILDTFVVLIVGYTIAQLIPMLISLNETRKLEKTDYQEWIHLRGFSDDKDNLFHKLFQWYPPKHGPSEMSEEDYQEKLKTTEGRTFLENYYTSKGVPIGSFKQKSSKSFDLWKKSEQEKYSKYFDDCTSGDNESGQVLRPEILFCSLHKEIV